ncbi:hypothetical protein DERF_011009 [Dermatophagoides farinae]|uniref:Uncharacterized protein n=1 Tax=Dermatophagoides farinae TaxID=6954 RepID=A0A922HW93_DERFA|nr:hypothetical protein DERF_011009 [Dermatophagoides farinae]
MIIGGQIPERTIEQNLTSEARDGFAMSWRSAFRAKPHERSELGWLGWLGFKISLFAGHGQHE